MELLPVGKLPHELLSALLSDLPADPNVIVGPGVGRDAAAVRVGEQILVFKTDPITFPTDDAGWYLVNINANDIACMGADPKWLLVTALFPEYSTTPELVETTFASLKSAALEIGCTIIGGHTEITEGLVRPVLVGQMIGTTSERALVDPTRAQPGDAILLIGGIAVEGTAILASDACEQLEGRIDPELLARGTMFDRSPGISVVSYARRLRETSAVDLKAMHDPTEGGLASGIRELGDATGLGVEINAASIMIHPETVEITSHLGIDPWGLIASGALLAVVDRESADAALASFADSDVPAAQIGRLTRRPGDRVLLINDERESIPEFAVDEIARYFSES